MAANPLIAFRVSPETKANLHALAQARNLTDSALLQKLVGMALLQHVGVPQLEVAGQVQQVREMHGCMFGCGPRITCCYENERMGADSQQQRTPQCCCVRTSVR